MAWISFGVLNVCEALKTQKNPRHALCPQKSNRTAVGLTRPSIILAKNDFLQRMGARVKPAHDSLHWSPRAGQGTRLAAPASNLLTPFNGPLTSGLRTQFQLLNPAPVSRARSF